MNNSIETICLSLSEKGQVIKNNVARSIENLHQQDEIQQPVSPVQKQSNSKAKIMIFGGLFCLATGVFLGITTQQQNTKQESEGNRIEQNNVKSQKKNSHSLLGTASVIMNILGVAGICSGILFSHKRSVNKSNISHMKEEDISRYSSDLIEAICSIKEKCSKEWDAAVMEHTNRCKQVIDTMDCSEDEKIEKKESVTTSSLIKYNSFDILQLIDSASSTNKISAINDAVEVCSKKLQDAIDSAISQQIAIYKSVMV